MIGNIKEIFLKKTGMWEKQLLQDPGYVGVVREMRDALLHACRIFIVVVGDIREGLNYILYYNSTIWIKKYFKLVLQIRNYFQLKHCVNSN